MPVQARIGGPAVVRIDIKIDTSSLERLAKKMPHAIDEGVHQVAQYGQAHAVKNASQDTGSMRSKIEVKKRGEAQYAVESNVRSDTGAPYGAFQEFGTGLYAEDWDGNPVSSRHRIYPRTAPRLKFTWKGKAWSLPSVAGVKPQHYMKRALDETLPRVNDIFARAFQQKI